MRVKLKISILDVIFLFFVTRLCFTPATVWPLFKVPIVLVVGIIGVLLSQRNREYNFYYQRRPVLYLIILLACIVLERTLASNAACIELINSYIENFLFLGVLWGVYCYQEISTELGDDSIVTKWYRLGTLLSLIIILYVEITGGGDLIRDTAVSYSTQYSFRYGGFDFVYALLIIYTAFLSGYIIWKEKICQQGKIVSRVLLILLAIAITLSNFTTAFALLAITTIYCYLPKKKLIRICTIVFVIVVFYLVTPLLATIIYDVGFLSDLTKTRLSNILLFISGQSTGVQYISGEGQRIELLLDSIKAFLQYPFFGALTNNQRNILGGHTEWIETLARFGLLVFIPYVCAWISSITNISNNLKSRNADISPFKNAVIIAILIGFLDPMNYLVTFTPLFLFAPFVDGFFKKYEVSALSDDSDV